jgi:hypothetical protein
VPDIVKAWLPLDSTAALHEVEIDVLPEIENALCALGSSTYRHTAADCALEYETGKAIKAANNIIARWRIFMLGLHIMVLELILGKLIETCFVTKCLPLVVGGIMRKHAAIIVPSSHKIWT